MAPVRAPHHDEHPKEQLQDAEHCELGDAAVACGGLECRDERGEQWEHKHHGDHGVFGAAQGGADRALPFHNAAGAPAAFGVEKALEAVRSVVAVG